MGRCWGVGVVGVDVAVADVVVGGVGGIGFGSVGDGIVGSGDGGEARDGDRFVFVADDGVINGVRSRRERGGSGQGTRRKSSDKR